MERENNSVKEWARHEIDLAIREDFEIPSEMKEEIDKHYEAAYSAFCSFVDKMEGLDKPGIMKTVFWQLLNNDPLTPIEDIEDEWVFVEGFDPAVSTDNPGFSIYHSKRRPSLYKDVVYDRKMGDIEQVKYSDTERYVCIDVNSERSYSGGMGPVILDEMLPIEMPYSPSGKIKIFTEDFKYYKDNDGDFDTIGIYYFRLPDGEMKKVGRFFKEDPKTHTMVEIDKAEYLARRKRANGI